MLDWLIIGGGFHGTALSFALTKRYGVVRDRLRVLDPHPRPLALWQHFTQNVGMRYLRSPDVHHLHHDPWSMRTFAATRRGEPLAAYIPKFNRPALNLLNAYHTWLIDHYDLEALRLQGRALGLQQLDVGWRVETDKGALQARNVILAMGNSEERRIPAWAAALPNVHHIFDPVFVRAALPDWEHVIVVGGGISAAQTANALLTDQPNGHITIWARHEQRISHFDSDPCWITALCLEQFYATDDPGKRREIIRSARQPGSMPPNVAERLQTQIQAGRVRWMQGNGLPPPADHIILCTGFTGGRPGGDWLDAAIDTYNLPLADDGYPVVDAGLRWDDGLYVTGPLAELEIGPVARNFIGARLASERIGRVIE